MSTEFESALTGVPVVAILRGVTPSEAAAIGEAVVRAGIRVLEVPLNSPEPLASIRELVTRLGDACVVGAGTVLRPSDVGAVADAGGRLVVSPNTSADVIAEALQRGVVPVPGFATATEAFQAYAAGARYLKLFPASTYGTAHVKALLAVLPRDAAILGVGGIAPQDIGNWISAGARGVGLGSEIYRPGDTPAAVFEKASAAVNALHQERK